MGGALTTAEIINCNSGVKCQQGHKKVFIKLSESIYVTDLCANQQLISKTIITKSLKITFSCQ